MPYIQYEGPFVDGVSVDLPNGRWISFSYGQPVDVSDDLAKALLAQGNIWKAVKKPPKDAPVDDPEQDEITTTMEND